jgi:glycosyltransferase XagB
MTREQRRASAAVLLTHGQKALTVLLLGGFIAAGVFAGWHGALQGIVALTILFYIIFSGFRHILWAASAFRRFPRYTLPDPDDPTLPKVSALIALRDEADSIGNLVKSIRQLRYRTDRLEVLLLIDEDDSATLGAAAALSLPEHIRVVKVPDAGPYLKPKVLLYGYPEATGAIIVPFDAEDRVPEDQLLHVVATYRAKPSDRRGRRIGGVQARLTFWNPRGVSGKSWISSMVYGEYCVQYQYTLPGMEKLGLIFPYGGTSCYFLREALDDVARQNGKWTFSHREDGSRITFQGPWDLNPTEDADIAYRLALAGWGSAMIDSSTNEEAPEHAGLAGRQGIRWLHGYGITGIVSLRRPLRSMRRVGVLRWMTFNLFMLGTLAALVLNPITWATAGLYMVSRFEDWVAVSSYIHGLFPTPVFYAGLLATAANFSFYLQKIFGVIKAQEQGEGNPATDVLSRHMQKEQYGITCRIAIGTPFWWAWRSVSAWRAGLRLLSPKNNHSWGHKTPHGEATELEARLAMELA